MIKRVRISWNKLSQCYLRIIQHHCSIISPVANINSAYPTTAKNTFGSYHPGTKWITSWILPNCPSFSPIRLPTTGKETFSLNVPSCKICKNSCSVDFQKIRFISLHTLPCRRNDMMEIYTGYPKSLLTSPETLCICQTKNGTSNRNLYIDSIYIYRRVSSFRVSPMNCRKKRWSPTTKSKETGIALPDKSSVTHKLSFIFYWKCPGKTVYHYISSNKPFMAFLESVCYHSKRIYTIWVPKNNTGNIPH